jgi:hypothetical protein
MQVIATMKALFLCGIAGGALGVHQGAAALDVDDCVLNGLKGVNSDAAARMVRQSCENKVASQKRQQILAKYGEGINSNLTHVEWNYYGNGDLKVTLKNDLSQTVIYAELSISKPKPNGECPYPVSRKHLYEVKAKPGSRLVLIVPDGASFVSKERHLCTSTTAVRGREPSVLDVSIGAFSPLSDSQVATVNDVLSERYATTESFLDAVRNMRAPDFLGSSDLRETACKNEAKRNHGKKPNEFISEHEIALEVFNCMARSAK